MSDFLKELCSNNKIKLVYTDNDYTILAACVSNNIPVIKVYNKFSDCPREVAEAIIGYYMENNKKYLGQIESFLEDDLLFLGYEIDPPDKMFLDLVNNKTNVKVSRTVREKENSSCYYEKDILSVTKKDFYGSVSKMNPDKSFKTSSDSITELDIVVSEE